MDYAWEEDCVIVDLLEFLKFSFTEVFRVVRG